MSTDDLGPVESFPHRQLRTTTDVICPPYLSFLHGGLHLQVTHHLFPRLPRHNLREASKLVKEYAKREKLVYAEFGFRKGNQDVVGVLEGVAQQAQLLKIVAEDKINKIRKAE
jgi:delta8-fatty-acid desaturase